MELLEESVVGGHLLSDHLLLLNAFLSSIEVLLELGQVGQLFFDDVALKNRLSSLLHLVFQLIAILNILDRLD